MLKVLALAAKKLAIQATICECSDYARSEGQRPCVINGAEVVLFVMPLMKRLQNALGNITWRRQVRSMFNAIWMEPG